MRTIEDHKVNPANDKITITVRALCVQGECPGVDEARGGAALAAQPHPFEDGERRGRYTPEIAGPRPLINAGLGPALGIVRGRI